MKRSRTRARDDDGVRIYEKREGNMQTWGILKMRPWRKWGAKTDATTMSVLWSSVVFHINEEFWMPVLVFETWCRLSCDVLVPINLNCRQRLHCLWRHAETATTVSWSEHHTATPLFMATTDGGASTADRSRLQTQVMATMCTSCTAGLPVDLCTALTDVYTDL